MADETDIGRTVRILRAMVTADGPVSTAQVAAATGRAGTRGVVSTRAFLERLNRQGYVDYKGRKGRNCWWLPSTDGRQLYGTHGGDNVGTD